jgi:uncharacterized protein YjbJ (UPF0337 family)
MQKVHLKCETCRELTTSAMPIVAHATATNLLNSGHMNPSTNDQIEGKLHEVKGKIKEVAGHAVGNPDLETEGRVETLAGKIENKVGQIKKVFEK